MRFSLHWNFDVESIDWIRILNSTNWNKHFNCSVDMIVCGVKTPYLESEGRLSCRFCQQGCFNNVAAILLELPLYQNPELWRVVKILRTHYFHSYIRLLINKRKTELEANLTTKMVRKFSKNQPKKFHYRIVRTCKIINQQVKVVFFKCSLRIIYQNCRFWSTYDGKF